MKIRLSPGSFRLRAVRRVTFWTAIALAAALRGKAKRDNSSGFSESERLLRGVLEREPKNISALFNLAVLYADYMKRPNDAEPLFKKFLSAASDKHPSRAEAERFLSAKK